MEENIEVKDVQKTEYLDKNGLDMLWAKVKENTRNQVEAESNRAVEQETRIIETKADKSEFSNYVPFATFTALEKKVSANTAAISNKQNAGNYLHYKTLNNDGYYEIPSVCVINEDDRTDTSMSSDEIKVNDENFGYTIITTDGVSNKYVTDFDFALGFNLNRNGIKLQGGDNNHVLTSNGSTIDITEYAKKTDIPEVNTSDFVSKSDTITQTINSGLIAMDKLQVFSKGYYNQTASLRGGIFVEGADTILTLNDTTASHNFMNLTASKLTMSQGVGDNTLLITTSGIANTDNNADHVYATDGSIADLTQYAKKSEITAGGNVDDVQVNGTSVVENKVANIKPATKESLGVVKVGDGLNVTDGTISVDPEYFVNMKSYGVEWDVTAADPACTRIGNPLLHKQLPIQSEYKGCLVKNGKVNYYLDPNDWSKKADGTPSVLDGTDGDVMVHIPKFYGKSGSNGNKRWVRISTTQVDSSWVEIPEMFVSAYRITTFNDSGTSKIASVVNTTTNYRGGLNRSDYDQYLSTDKFRTDLGKPRTKINIQTMRTNASISGQELLCYEFYKWVFYWAYVIEYANFNSQKEFNSELTSDGYHQGGLGTGLTTFDYASWRTYNDNCAITPCGYTNEFGNFSGVKTIQIQSPETTLYANRWRGFENPFGDISTDLEGVIVKRDEKRANSNVYTTTDVSKYGEDYSLFNIAGVEIGNNGWIKTFNIGSKAEIIPSSVDGSSSTYKCDFIYCNPNLTDKRWLCVGGNASNIAQAGFGFLASDNNYNGSGNAVGFRSVIRA